MHPQYAVTVDEVNADLTALVHPEEVVTVEIVLVDGAFLVTFSSDDPAPAMSVLPGGPPWLIQEPPQVDVVSVDSHDSDGNASTSAERWLYEEIERLEQRLRELEAENRQLRRVERERRRIAIPRVYADPVEQLRLEFHLAYLSRVSESDRGQYPWPLHFSISPLFVESMERLVMAGGIAREKIVEVCVEVLCGLATGNRSRAVKEWLESRHGRPLVRADGSTAWRVRLQHKSNAARRLRYWRLPTGEIELDWVGAHDEDLR